MSAIVIVGAQWGDEGKGKVVDLFTQYADVVVRYGGGANAGHTLVVGGEKVVFHLMPSGALHKHTGCVLGGGMVIDPETLLQEIDELKKRNLLDAEEGSPGRLRISEHAHVVLPHHKEIDRLRDQGKHKIGTTHRGIGPCYEDKVGRRGIRLSHLRDASLLRTRVEQNLAAWAPLLEHSGACLPNANALVEHLQAFFTRIARHVCNTSTFVEQALDEGKKVLLEGAQGTLLDIDNGTYPFVTSSSVTSAGACIGAGIPPKRIGRCLGIAKAYTTRVGEGPFPTELEGELAKRMRDQGQEYGATTGRPRRCGWLDAVALRMAVRVNGLDALTLTKLDVLQGFETLKICRAYRIDGVEREHASSECWEKAEPVYEDLPGFTEDISGATDRKHLPENAQAYLARVSELVGCPIEVVSVGAERSAVLGLEDPFA